MDENNVIMEDITDNFIITLGDTGSGYNEWQW
jgi:hypothetical protein